MRGARSGWIVGGLANVFACVVLVSAGRSASAEPTCAPADTATSATEDKAEALYKKGVEARAREEWETARVFFSHACAVSPHYQILAHLGEAELKLGRYRAAAEHLSAFLAAAPPTLSTAARTRGEEMLAEARSHVGTVALTVNVPDAEVLVDGESVGRAPMKSKLFVDPGLREFEARGAGGVKAKTLLGIAPGAEVTVQLEPKPQGSPRIGLPLRQEPAPTQPQSVKILPSEPDLTTGSTGASGGLRSTLITTSLVGSAAATAVGIGNVIAVFALPNPNDNRTQQIFGNAALYSFMAAGGLGLGALTLWATQPASKTHEASTPTVSVAAGGPGIRIVGQW